MMANQTVAEMLNPPVPAGTMRILWCQLCGAITAIKTQDGTVNGDPEAHNRYHASKGERL